MKSDNLRCALMGFVVSLVLAVGAVVLCSCQEGTRPRGTVRLYTSVPTDVMTQIEAEFERAHPGLDLSVYRDGTGKVMARIHEEIEEFKISDMCHGIRYHFPDYGEKSPTDGLSMPFEAVFSKFVFCKASMLQSTKGNSPPVPYEAYIAFYLGDIQGYPDLRFIGLALRQFQMLKTDELIVYTLRDPVDIRNEIVVFKEEFQLATTSPDQVNTLGQSENNVEFRQLVPNNQLPSWMVRYD